MSVSLFKSFRTFALSLLFACCSCAFASDTQENLKVYQQQSDAWFLQQVGGRQIRVDDQVLDVRVQHLMEQSFDKDGAESETENEPDINTDSGRNALRETFDEYWVAQTLAPPSMDWIREIKIPSRDGNSIPAKVYKPQSKHEQLPVLVYFHGGGWVFGSVTAVDPAVQWMASAANVIVVSVDYRLAPEHPYPAGWDDAEDAFDWVVANGKQYNGDTSKVCVGGDSAGGNLSIAVSTRKNKQGAQPPHCQLLYYPGVDNRDIPTMRANYLSARLFGVGFWLDYTFTEYVLPITFPGYDLSTPEISPLFASKQEMETLPATLLVAAGFDPLRDSNRAYAQKLKEAGVDISYREVPTLIHGIINLTAITPVAHKAALDVARELGSIAHR